MAESDINVPSSAPDQLERAEDTGKDKPGRVKRWLMEIDLASRTEEKWRKRGKMALERYRDETERTDNRYNIYWANVETLIPLLYSTPPKMDVRSRFETQDEAAKAAAEVIERALEYCIDTYDFDEEISNVLYNFCIPSRGVARVRFEPTIETKPYPKQQSADTNSAPSDEQKSIMQDAGATAQEGDTSESAAEDQSDDEDDSNYDELTYARCYIEHVPWDRFRRGPGITWKEVPWVAYEHQLTRSELDKLFPEFDGSVDYDITMEGVTKEKAGEEPSVFKRIRVWEIWDKSSRKVLWLAPSCKEDFLNVEDDKLELDDFFDCERPLYAVNTATTLVPKVEYDMYKDQAKELDRVTNRIGRLVNTLKQRGIYDSTISEFEKLFKADDNEMIPTSTANTAMAAGGMDRAVWMLPIGEAAAALKELVTYRESLKMIIYEITGIGDIMRGQSDPNETYGAQKLKEQTGTRRVQRKQRDIQRFIRGLLRKKAEIICQNYTPELLSLMTGVKLPYEADKAKAQQQVMLLQQAQPPMNAGPPASGQQPATQTAPPGGPPQPSSVPPELLATIKSPSWEQVMAILRNDMLRSFRIDIETDSTIATDVANEREQVTELITGIGSFVSNIGPAVQEGAMSVETAKQILLACLRKFKLGREVEDIIEQESNKPPPPAKPDPEMAKVQAQMALEKFEAENDAKLAVTQQQAQAAQDQQSQSAEAQRKDRELSLKHDFDMQKMQFDHNLDMQKMRADHAAQLQQIEAKKQSDIERDAHTAKLAEKPAAVVHVNGGEEIKNLANTLSEASNKHSTAAEGIAHVAPALAQAAQALAGSISQHGALADKMIESHSAFAKALTDHNKIMAADVEAVRDRNGRIIRSRKVVKPEQ